MNKKWIKLSSVALLSLYLAACDANDEEVSEDQSAELVEEETTEIEESDENLDSDEEESESETDLEEDEESADTHEENDAADADVMETIQIEGVGDHYHTGELVELTAVLEEENEYDDWHWYMRTDEEAEWEMISGQNSDEYIGEAPEQTVDMRVVLYDDSHEAYAQSEPVELEVDNH